MDESMDEGKQIEKAKDRRIWLIKAGEKGERWSKCVNKGIICGGWKEIVEKYGEKLFKFKNFKECKKKMNKISKPNDKWPTYICKFLYEVSVGDIVLAARLDMENKVNEEDNNIRDWCNNRAKGKNRRR